MSYATLRATCIERTCGLLMKGVWDECEENPFSYMPINVVQDLLFCMWPPESVLSKARVAGSRLLLRSGSLEHFVLPRGVRINDYVLLLRMLSRGCQNLRTLSIRHSTHRRQKNVDAERVLRSLLQNCAKLEHIYSYVNFHPNDIRKCRNLKTLKLYLKKEQCKRFTRRITSNLMKHLQSVEVFALYRCQSDDCELFREFFRGTVSILKNCPRVSSLGFLESSDALRKIHYRDLRKRRNPRLFQLRKCYWNEAICVDLTVRLAVLSCPLVEVLVVKVANSRELQHLKALTNLTSLHITLSLIEDGERRDLYSLLEEIGPQLRHLYISTPWEHPPLCLNLLFRNCPNLNTLELQCQTSVDKDDQACVSLMSLERLGAISLEQESLFFLLTNCLRLKVLCLEYGSWLDDNAMETILRRNPFQELEVLICRCLLSMSGWRRFVESALKLSKYCLESQLLSHVDAIRCVRDLNLSASCHSLNDFSKLREEQFAVNL